MRATCVAAVACALAAASFTSLLADGTASFVLGSRVMADDDLWEPSESQDYVGIVVDFGKSGWPLHVAIGVHTSFTEEDLVDDPVLGVAERDTSITELSFGVVRRWGTPSGMRPFVGGGVSDAEVMFTFPTPIGDLVQSDETIAFYVEGGIDWQVGTRFIVGFALRVLAGPDVDIEGAEGSLNSMSAGLVLGWRWPRRN